MSMKILSLSLILVIANFMHGMTTQERDFYTEELRKAKKNFMVASLTENKLRGEYTKTNIGQIYLQKWEDDRNCKQLGLNCDITRDDFDKAHENYFGSEEYKKKISPASNETDFHSLKVRKLESLLSGSDPEVIIKNLEKPLKKLAIKPSNNEDTINHAKRCNRVAQYFRSLPEKRIESTMPQYQ